jgi:hypothetical protein
MGQEGSLVAWAEVGVVEDGGRRGRGCADRLGSYRSRPGSIVVDVVLRGEKVVAIRRLVVIDVVRGLMGGILRLHHTVSSLPWWPQVRSIVVLSWNAV